MKDSDGIYRFKILLDVASEFGRSKQRLPTENVLVNTVQENKLKYTKREIDHRIVVFVVAFVVEYSILGSVSTIVGSFIANLAFAGISSHEISHADV